MAGKLLEYAESLAKDDCAEAVHISTNHYGLYKKYEKGLACDEYIEDLRVVVNKRLLVNTPITKAELDNHDYSTYVKHGEEVTDLALSNKDKYTQILLDILVDFQDNYVAKRTYAGTLLDKKVCFVKPESAVICPI
jgi:hypothetical protein